MNMNQKINQALENKQDQTNWTPVIKFVGGIIYLTGLIYAGSHVFSWVSSIMADDFLRVMGYIGGTGIILNGAVLPLAIHSWTMEKKHRLAAMSFYALDIAMIMGFVWANTNLARGTGLVLAEQYLTWISPITFINTILTWGVLTILDPENRIKYRILVAQQQAEEIKIKTDAYLQITAAENESLNLFEQAGLDPETLERLPRPERIPEPTRNPDYISFDQKPEKIFVPERPEMDTRSGNHSGTVPKV